METEGLLQGYDDLNSFGDCLQSRHEHVSRGVAEILRHLRRTGRAHPPRRTSRSKRRAERKIYRRPEGTYGGAWQPIFRRRLETSLRSKTRACYYRGVYWRYGDRGDGSVGPENTDGCEIVSQSEALDDIDRNYPKCNMCGFQGAAQCSCSINI
jgi:hypothetical protein